MPQKTEQNDSIQIWGARQNNLKNIDVSIPASSLTVVTGVSGSGKSSLAFDTLYAEGQRRYVESLSAYARQFLERIPKPHVREIEGIRPAIAIRQKSSTRNPRSTVGTVTEVNDFLRLVYSRIGTILCRDCGREVRKDEVDQVVDQLMRLPDGTRFYVTFPFAGSHLDLNSEKVSRVGLPDTLENMTKQGFHRLFCPDPPGVFHLPLEAPRTVEDLQDLRVLVDRLVVGPGIEERLADSLETCFAEAHGLADVYILTAAGSDQPPKVLRYSERFECQYCHRSYRSPEPALFSFNNPYGACPNCQGFGNTIGLDPELVIPDPNKPISEGPIDPFTKPRYKRYQQKLEQFVAHKGFDPKTPFSDLPEEVRSTIWTGTRGFPGVKGFFEHLETKKYKMHVRIFIARYRGYTRCPDCDGERLCSEARDIVVGGKRITELSRMPISHLAKFFRELDLPPQKQEAAQRLVTEIRQRLDFLMEVGLHYLTLDRLTSTLSGGEMQRIHLAASLGSSLVGTLYILDEPSVGLHPRDERQLINILKELRDLGNTVVVVEHDQEMMAAADHVIDMGPGAGDRGGEVVHAGNFESLVRSQSLTARYLRGELRIPTPHFRRSTQKAALTIRGARTHNLQNIDVRIPLGALVCITGVSGSGKSTLVHDCLYAGLMKLRGEWKGEVGSFKTIEGWDLPTEVLLVDQNPIGKTPRSNPVTYLKAYDQIRNLFASLREAHARNLSPGSFSFNIPGGRCETCMGAGFVTVEMQFLADVELLCEDCKGTRFKSRTLEVRYKGKNIHEVLEMTVDEAIHFFSSSTSLVRKLKVLQEVGLGYLRLGQSATTLSGGEAQRIKLAAFLSRTTSKKPLFFFDEPTTGLHFDDISKLLKAFDRLIAAGGSVVVIEHNLDVIRSADWIIDLGPEGGEAGGQIVAEGTPEELSRVKTSHTGRFLAEVLSTRAAG